MKKKIISLFASLLLCVVLLTGCKDRDFEKVLNVYNNIDSSGFAGYEQTITIKPGAFEYVSYTKRVEFNGESYKITEINVVQNEIGEQNPTASTTEVYYIDDGYLIKDIEGVLTKTEQVGASFEEKYNLTKDNLVDYSIVKEKDKMTFSAHVKEEKFSSFVNTALTDVNDMLITINILNEKIVDLSLEYHKKNGSEITILTTLNTSYSNFAVPDYQE